MHSQGNARNEIRDPKNIYFDTRYWSIKPFGKGFDELVLRLLPPSWILLPGIPKQEQIWRKMIVQQLGLTKLNILCKIEPNSLPKEFRYLKYQYISWFLVVLAVILDFTVWNFVPREIWETVKLSFSYLVSLTEIRSQNLVPKKWSRILRNFLLLSPMI